MGNDLSSIESGSPGEFRFLGQKDVSGEILSSKSLQKKNECSTCYACNVSFADLLPATKNAKIPSEAQKHNCKFCGEVFCHWCCNMVTGKKFSRACDSCAFNLAQKIEKSSKEQEENSPGKNYSQGLLSQFRFSFRPKALVLQDEDNDEEPMGGSDTEEEVEEEKEPPVCCFHYENTVLQHDLSFEEIDQLFPDDEEFGVSKRTATELLEDQVEESQMQSGSDVSLEKKVEVEVEAEYSESPGMVSEEKWFELSEVEEDGDSGQGAEIQSLPVPEQRHPSNSNTPQRSNTSNIQEERMIPIAATTEMVVQPRAAKIDELCKKIKLNKTLQKTSQGSSQFSPFTSIRQQDVEHNQSKDQAFSSSSSSAQSSNLPPRNVLPTPFTQAGLAPTASSETRKKVSATSRRTRSSKYIRSRIEKLKRGMSPKRLKRKSAPPNRNNLHNKGKVKERVRFLNRAHNNWKEKQSNRENKFFKNHDGLTAFERMYRKRQQAWQGKEKEKGKKPKKSSAFSRRMSFFEQKKKRETKARHAQDTNTADKSESAPEPKPELHSATEIKTEQQKTRLGFFTRIKFWEKKSQEQEDQQQISVPTQQAKIEHQLPQNEPKAKAGASKKTKKKLRSKADHAAARWKKALQSSWDRQNKNHKRHSKNNKPEPGVIQKGSIREKIKAFSSQKSQRQHQVQEPQGQKLKAAAFSSSRVLSFRNRKETMGSVGSNSVSATKKIRLHTPMRRTARPISALDQDTKEIRQTPKSSHDAEGFFFDTPWKITNSFATTPLNLDFERIQPVHIHPPGSVTKKQPASPAATRARSDSDTVASSVPPSVDGKHGRTKHMESHTVQVGYEELEKMESQTVEVPCEELEKQTMDEEEVVQKEETEKKSRFAFLRKFWTSKTEKDAISGNFFTSGTVVDNTVPEQQVSMYEVPQMIPGYVETRSRDDFVVLSGAAEQQGA